MVILQVGYIWVLREVVIVGFNDDRNHPRRSLLLPFLSLTLLAGTACLSFGMDAQAAAKAYQTAGRAVVDKINSGSLDLALVTEKVIEQQRQAVALGRAYAVKHPEGTKLINYIISQAVTVDAAGNVTGLGPMAALDFKSIEDEFHDLGHFKTKPEDAGGLDLSNEDHEHFTDPLHTIIHPLMVVAAARAWTADKKAEHLAEAKGEMEEGIEQAEKTAETLSK